MINEAKTIETATGKVDYTFTNDYMFRIVFQENLIALKGLICSVLCMEEHKVKEIKILNPIVPGKAIDNKTFIMDIKITLNDDTILNLEMQVRDEGNWQERSLSYLCRNFDNLNKGSDYSEIKKAIHIGFLNYTLFPDKPEFCAAYMMQNIRNHNIYSSKFLLKVIELNQIELATDEDRANGIDQWAKLFNSTTWEEFRMCAQNNEAIEEAVKDIYKYNSDWLIREECIAREEYYARQKYKDDKIKTLTEQVADKDKTIEGRDAIIADRDEEIARLKERLSQYE